MTEGSRPRLVASAPIGGLFAVRLIVAAGMIGSASGAFIGAPAAAQQLASPQTPGHQPPSVAAGTFLRAEELAAARDFAEAEPLYRQALAEQERILGADHPDTIRTVMRLALCVVSLRNAARGEGFALLERALAWHERSLGPDNPETVRLTAMLIQLYRNNGNHAGVQALRERELAALEGQQDAGALPNAADQIEAVLREIADVLDAQGLRAEAEARHARIAASLARDEQALRPQLEVTPPAQPMNGMVVQSTAAQTQAIRLFSRMHEEAQSLRASRRFAASEDIFRRALALMRRVAGDETIFAVSALTGLGDLLVMQGRYDEAEQTIRETMAVRERTFAPGSPQRLMSAIRLSALYTQTGRYDEAEQVLLGLIGAQEAVQATSATLFNDRSGVIAFQVALGSLYERQGRYREAESALVSVLQFFDRNGEPRVNPAAGALVPGARGSGRLIKREAVLALARVWRAQGHLDQAEQLILDNLGGPALQRTSDSDIPYLTGLADIYVASGRSEDAAALYARALAISEERGTPATRADVLLGQAGLLLERGDLAGAERAYGRLLESAGTIFGGDHPVMMRARRGLVAAQLRLPDRVAAALAAARQLNQDRRGRVAAAAQVRSANGEREAQTMTEIPRLLADADWSAAEAGVESRASLQREAFAALQDAISTPAGLALQRGAARQAADRAATQLGELVNAREELDRRWTANMEAFSATLGNADDGAERARRLLRDERSGLESELHAADARIRAQFPTYFEMVRPSPIGIEDVQALLSERGALLLVVPGPNGTHVAAVTRDGFAWQRVALTEADVAAAVRRLRFDAHAPVEVSEEEARAWQPEGERLSFDRGTAFGLYQQLVAPFESLLAGKQTIYVSTGGALSALPFTILVTQPPSGRDDDPVALRGTAWFGDQVSLVHIPSVRSLATLLQSTAGSLSVAGAFVGVGNPILGPAARREPSRRLSGAGAAPVALLSMTRSGQALADVGQLRRLESLPGTGEELERMREVFNAPPSSLLVRERAREPAIRQANLSGLRILAFATHGATAADTAASLAEPGLVLTPPAHATAEDDGFLAASEIAALHLDADWVLLSACNTASSAGEEAPGLGGLARAFLYAGARSLLVSHWPVSDLTAPILTVRTIELERAGTPRAEALRQAMREVRMDARWDDSNLSWAHPFFWAPFVLVGNGGE